MTNSEAKAKAAEMLQVLAIWGMSRTEAFAVSAAMSKMALNMSDPEYEALRPHGVHIKPGAPADVSGVAPKE